MRTTVKIFGPKPWGPAIDDPSMFVGRLKTEGETCLRCGEPVTSSEEGAVMPYLGEKGPELRVEHRECLLRSIFGSVGHQRGLCACGGGPGTMDDPPGMTMREAARAAVAEFEKSAKEG